MIIYFNPFVILFAINIEVFICVITVNESEVRKLLKRYMDMDPEGTDGIGFKDLCAMPEFSGWLYKYLYFHIHMYSTQLKVVNMQGGVPSPLHISLLYLA